jgi:hypothetical protein
MKVQMQVEVSQEAYNLVQALVKLAVVTKQALADGFQPTQDLPLIVMEAFKDLPPAVGGLNQLGPEFQEDKAAFVKAFVLGAADLFDLLAQKKA